MPTLRSQRSVYPREKDFSAAISLMRRLRQCKTIRVNCFIVFFGIVWELRLCEVSSTRPLQVNASAWREHQMDFKESGLQTPYEKYARIKITLLLSMLLVYLTFDSSDCIVDEMP